MGIFEMFGMGINIADFLNHIMELLQSKIEEDGEWREEIDIYQPVENIEEEIKKQLLQQKWTLKGYYRFSFNGDKLVATYKKNIEEIIKIEAKNEYFVDGLAFNKWCKTNKEGKLYDLRYSKRKNKNH